MEQETLNGALSTQSFHMDVSGMYPDTWNLIAGALICKSAHNMEHIQQNIP